MDWLAEKKTPSVLIVEDDPVAAMLLKRMFTKRGVQVDTVDNAESGLQLHREHNYRLIISDWVLPETSGVELCRQLRRIGGPYVYFILCTCRKLRQDRLEAFEAGVDDFIVKPIDQEELEARINVASRLLRSRDLLESQKLELQHSAQRLSDANQNLALASRRFEELFNGVPVACFTLDSSGLIREWNRSATELFGLEAFEVLDRPVWKVFEQSEPLVLSPTNIKHLFEGQELAPFDWKLNRSGGEPKYFAGHLICLRNAGGRALAAMCANVDVTERVAASARIERYAEQLTDQKHELERMNARLGHLAVTDGLTGLWNHRRFQEMLEDTIQFHRVREVPFSLVLVDIDHFKRLNDDFGHQHGDEVLRLFADTLRATARVGELSSRYGGEEFAMLLQGCAKDAALRAVERYQKAIRAQPWPGRAVTASFGISTYSDWDTTGQELVREADRALYASKNSGRDCATHCEDIPDLESRCA